MRRLSFLLLVLLSLSLPALAAIDFSTADALFAQRENSPSNIAQARGLYQEALKSGQGRELVHAMEQLGRLAYYEGELLTPEDDHGKRVAIFQQCQDDVEKISPSKLGKEVAAYYYWKAACLALWGKSASSWSVPGRLGSLEDAMNKGLALDPSFEGGGMHRVIGSVYLKSKGLRWIPGLWRFFDPNKALEHIEMAVRIGPQYYVAWLTKAEVLKELGRSDEGLKLLQDKKRELELLKRANNLPSGLEAESKLVLRQMSNVMAGW
jgi:tetratricopeptide (TPR) repeat protein